MKTYPENEWLMLSGIQHYVFCKRQWALIHLEGEWQENFLTTEGKIIHERVHNEDLTEKRGDLIICRGMRIFSDKLGISGVSDAVEFHKSEEGALLAGYDGFWRPIPIEYKHGKPKADHSDILQVVAQAMCLEEMFCVNINEACLFYDKIHRREKVEITSELREEVQKAFEEMHQYFKRGYTPKVKIKKACKSCSLKDVCLPELTKRQSVASYYESFMEVD
ncbi:MAG: CRISPR-associated protein Cas4 [Selenomonadaceae bacterium]|nr:CRISPR-associated protein Cas4 [Selenomonadaceae bacterium]